MAAGGRITFASVAVGVLLCCWVLAGPAGLPHPSPRSVPRDAPALLQQAAAALAQWLRLPGWGAGGTAAAQPPAPPHAQALSVASGFMHAKALEAACRLDIATLLGDGRVSAAELAGRLGVQAGRLERVLRALAAVGIFRQAAPGALCRDVLISFGVVEEARCSWGKGEDNAGGDRI